MAVAHWYDTYKMLYTPAEREEEAARLKVESRSLNSSQQRGDAGYTKDLAELREKMAALAKIKGEESGGPGGRGDEMRGVVDFSKL
jgi:hypothetical protein